MFGVSPCSLRLQLEQVHCLKGLGIYFALAVAQPSTALPPKKEDHRLASKEPKNQWGKRRFRVS